jgi:ribonuclease P protein component
LNNSHVHSLRKHEILRKKQLISLLFSSGKSVKGDFLRIVYASLKPEAHIVSRVPAILFAVSKKTVSSSVRRNRVKRMMREAYRLEKSLLQSKKDPSCDDRNEMLCIVFLYMGRKKTFPDLEAFREEIRVLMGNMILS